MKKIINMIQSNSYFPGIILLAIGTLLTIVPSLPLVIVSYCISACALLISIYNLIRIYKNRYDVTTSVFVITFYILIIFFSIYYLIRPTILVRLITKFLALIIIISGLNKLDKAINLKKYNNSSWYFPLISALLVLIAGIFALFNPITAQETLMLFLGISLMVSAISELISVYLLKKNNR